ncbi:hypothetical protein T265_12338 [Opisthorchis viverrini]|uniref:Uncharacterized protein n=1 Tax=Opisthorchis viverrini TaxID=6198 RepID=A0A074Z4K5_OPIVI|nr:hypothetical protein T265_12338 [Opisthorchis viverrini]KER18215.1 hypothetical protein T265_12338 [Opisthorchis viverrini]
MSCGLDWRSPVKAQATMDNPKPVYAKVIHAELKIIGYTNYHSRLVTFSREEARCDQNNECSSA